MTFLKTSRVIAALMLTLDACSDSGSTAPKGQISFRLLSATRADTIGASLPTALEVQALSEAGKPRAGAIIQFRVLSDAALYGVQLANMSGEGTASVTTKADGMALVPVVLGDRTGSFRVVVTEARVAHEDTATFDVRPGQAVRLVVRTGDTLTTVGGSYAPVVSTFDRRDNSRTDAAALTSNAPACRTQTGSIVGVSVGNCTIQVSIGALRDSILLGVVPPNVRMLVTLRGLSLGGVLSSMNLDGSNYKVLQTLNNADFDSFRPDWSESAALMAVQETGTDNRLHIRLFDNAGTSHRLVVATPPNSDENYPRFSRDGQWIYFSSRTDPSFAPRVWRAHPDGSSATPLTPLESGFGNKTNAADVSADGQTLAYGNQGLTLRLLNIPSGHTTGVQVAIASLRADPKLPRFAILEYDYRLAMVNSDGSGYRLVTPDSMSGMLDWLPDGEWIMTRKLFKSPFGTLSDGERILLNVTTGQRVRIKYNLPITEISIMR